MNIVNGKAAKVLYHVYAIHSFYIKEITYYVMLLHPSFLWGLLDYIRKVNRKQDSCDCGYSKVCLCSSAYVRACIHACACMHTCMRVNACMHVGVHACKCVCTSVCAQVCVHAIVCARTSVCAHEWVCT